MNPAEIKAQFEEMKRLWEEFKTDNDRRLKEVGSRKWEGEPIVNGKLDKMNEAMDKYHARLEKMETAGNRAGSGADPEMDSKAILHSSSQAIDALMRRGPVKGQAGGFDVNRVLQEELLKARAKEFNDRPEYRRLIEAKAMSVEVDSEGGYLVRPAVADFIMKTIFETSPIRQFASVATISTDSWEMPYDISEVSVGWVGEQEARTTTTASSLKLINIPVHEIYAMPALTQKMLDDAGMDIEGYHRDKVADKMSREEAAQFINGTGVKKPAGFLGGQYTLAAASSTQATTDTLFNTLEYIASASGSATFDADSVIDTQNKLYEQYQTNARWLMHRTTAGTARKLKDSQNRYLWSLGEYPGLLNGIPAYLLDKPVHFAADMPVVAANAYVAIYGDFKYYQVIDRLGIRVLKDPYTTKGQILYYTTKRVGGGVTNFQAFKILKCHS